jgi:hypothetical protein
MIQEFGGNHAAIRTRMFSRVGVDGVEIGTELRITDGDGRAGISGSDSTPVWTGSEYMLPWARSGSESATFYLSRLTPVGSTTASQVVDDPTSAISWSGSVFGRVWANDSSGNYDVYMGFVDAEGSVAGDSIQMTEDLDGQAFSNLIWTGSSYGVVWLDGRDTGCSPLPYEFNGDCHAQIYMEIVEPDGVTIWDDVKLTWRDSWKLFTSMAWTGSEFGLAWFEIYEDEWYISFDRISFCD